jgi:hypothetical protein
MLKNKSVRTFYTVPPSWKENPCGPPPVKCPLILYDLNPILNMHKEKITEPRIIKFHENPFSGL